MLKWAVSPRLNCGEYFEHKDMDEFLTLQNILEQHELPCLVRLINNDRNQSIDNYCLLLCEINDPYLIASNETERFSIPISFDGLFASVERGITRYNIFQSIQSLQSHFKSSSFDFTHFTTLQPYVAYSNSILRRIRPGTLLEPCRRSNISNQSPSLTTTMTKSNRLRTLFTNLPHSLNKHLSSNYQQTRLIKKSISPNDYFEVKSNLHDDIFTLKPDSIGIFVPVYTQLLSINSLNLIQGLYTTDLLSQLVNQYPLITELIISRTLEENVPIIVGYPFRRITLHRLVENHPRIIAFDMKNYAFIEIDLTNSIDMYVIEHDNTLFQRYQAQLRWCHNHIQAFRSQIKTIVHSSNGTAMFIQATPFHGQQLQEYYQRRNSTAILSSPLVKHIPKTIFTSQESIHLRTDIPILSKFYTTSNHSKYEQKQRHKGKTIGSNDNNTSSTLSLNNKHSNYQTNSTESDSIDADEETENSFQCTAL